MKRIVFVFSIAYILLSSVGAWAGPMKVFVSISPQKYFVEKIGGDLVDVTVMVPPGANPHNYEPKPRQMVDLSKARIYFALGVTFEDVWLDKIASANPDMKIVHTEKGIIKIPMETHRHHDHDSSPGETKSDGDHHHGADHGILDPHVWTSPVRVGIMAENIYQALVGIDPDNKKTYEAGRQAFMRELDGLDSEFRKILAHSQGMKFMVFHPAWGYLAHDYGLVQIPVEVEGKEPKPAPTQGIDRTRPGRGGADHFCPASNVHQKRLRHCRGHRRAGGPGRSPGRGLGPQLDRAGQTIQGGPQIEDPHGKLRDMNSAA